MPQVKSYLPEVNFMLIRTQKVQEYVLIFNSRKYEVVVVGQKKTFMGLGRTKKVHFFSQKMQFSKKLRNDSRMLLERSNDNN